LKDPVTRLVLALVVILTALLGCFCLAAGGAASLFYRFSQAITLEPSNPLFAGTPTPHRVIGNLTPTPSLNRQTLDPTALDTLKTLEAARPALNDPYDLARRLENKENIPTAVPAPERTLQVGDEQSFWVSNAETHDSFQVTAVLRYIGQHLYFWVEQGVNYNEDDIRKLVETFDNQIYPTNRAFFGSEWTPGVDNDPRLYLVYAKGLGNHLAGYFSSADELNPAVHKYSNAHELFLISADNVRLGEQYIYGTMAHEFQHMIHWNLDLNEEAWLNEGFSVLAEFLNGYYVPGFDYTYSLNTDLALTGWSSISGENNPHYGAAFLFLDYFLNRFGEKTTRDLAASPLHGMASVDAVLAADGITDPLTGKTITAEDVFGDWAAANILNDPSVGDGRYSYANYPDAPKTQPALRVSSCPTQEQTRSVNQFGVAAILISCQGQYQLNFQGSAEVNLLSTGAYSGEYAFWSNQGDSGDMSLTRTFDFTQVSTPISMDYHTWYDLEKDFDYVYLEASLDGQEWQVLTTPSCTMADVSGNSFGCGYNGNSQGWVEEKVDLSQFIGKKVQLRFEYVTDAGITGGGFLLDDIRVPAIDYFADFEKDDGGWQAVDFLRVGNHLPQTYRVTLILKGDQTTVQNLTLNTRQRVVILLNLGVGVKEAVLLVSGTTRFTSLPAVYQFSISP
jgi:immune inhibitor A